jgi:proline iminopeptidase
MEDLMRSLYPPLEPRHAGHLKVSDLHDIYYEECGNPKGLPALFVHGGPGGGTVPQYRQYFDPEAYRIVLFDQRGCGKSRPHASLEENTTWHLVDDMEKLRGSLDIERWLIFGGSWGSTLALAYAQAHPERVAALVLRGIFLLRRSEIRWFYQEGAHHIFPDAWEEYVRPIPPEERGDMVSAYYRRLTSGDPAVRAEAAKAWSVWEAATSKLFPDSDLIRKFGGDTFADAFARIECHYFTNDGFLRPDQLLDEVGRIRRIPAVIVQGRYDIVCPMISAWELHRRWPEAEFHLVPDAGHAASEPGIIDRLIEATDRFRRLSG